MITDVSHRGLGVRHHTMPTNFDSQIFRHALSSTRKVLLGLADLLFSKRILPAQEHFSLSRLANLKIAMNSRG